MAILALLSISQAAKAAEVTVYFQKPDGWSTSVQAYVYDDLGNHPKEWQDADACSRFYTSTGVELWSYTFSDQFTNVIFKDGTNQYPANNGTKMKVVNNCVYNTKSTTGTSLSEFVKNSAFTYTLTGGYEGGGWSDESANFEFVGDGKYTYTFTAAQDGEFRFRVNTSYTSKAALCPNVDGNTKRKKLTSTPEDVAYNDQNDASGKSMSDNYWFCDVTKGKKYTFTLTEQYNSTNDSYTRKLSVVTKVIKLLNGTSELTGSNGSYTLDLSGETSSDAKITLTINDAKYGLATAQTISAVGTTNVDFVANAPAALTLTKGFIYSLSVTEDGKMTVVAEEKVNPVITADAGYYLVGNFFSKHNIDGGDPEDEINYSRLYFKFKDNGIVDHVHTYSMDIPASISAYMQILSVDDNNVKVVYGPGEIKAVSAATLNTNTSLTGTTLLKSSDLSKGGNYWSLTTRNDGTHDDDGMYTISFTESNGVPTNWTITHNAFKRVSYLISCAEGASAQPLYNKRGADELTSSFTDETKEYVHFDGNSQYYAISNVVFSRDYGTEQNPQPMYVAQKIDNSVHVLQGHDSRPTHSKLFLLGNGGEEYSTANNYNLLSPNENAIKFSLKGTYFVRINPSQGHREIAIENDHYGINVEIFTGTGTPDYPDAISMVGPAIASTTTTVGDKTTWNWASTAGDMTYDENDRCYKLVLNTTDDMVGKTFRFVGDHAITQNWYEDQTKANIQYPTTQGGFSDATVADPNYVNYTKECTEGNIEHANDILWNRGAGLWTVRFYIDKSQTGDNAVFYYTITGASKIYIPVTAHMGKLLRTYTSAVDVVPVDKEVLIYAAQSYTKNNVNNTGSGDETGTVKL